MNSNFKFDEARKLGITLQPWYPLDTVMSRWFIPSFQSLMILPLDVIYPSTKLLCLELGRYFMLSFIMESQFGLNCLLCCKAFWLCLDLITPCTKNPYLELRRSFICYAKKWRLDPGHICRAHLYFHGVAGDYEGICVKARDSLCLQCTSCLYICI